MAGRGPLRVAVACDQSLVGDSVQAALRERGFETSSLAWPSLLRGSRPTRRRGVDVGLVLCELDSPRRVEEARAVLGLLSLPWLVITGAPRGSAWGALLEAGAAQVISSEAGLGDIVATLDALAVGGGEGASTPPVAPRAADDPLVREWADACRMERAGAGRLASLTPREREVLEHLHDGDAVTTIADDLGVSAATVRSQVKAILRKLEVNSQLGAVAVLAEQAATAR